MLLPSLLLSLIAGAMADESFLTPSASGKLFYTHAVSIAEGSGGDTKQSSVSGLLDAKLSTAVGPRLEGSFLGNGYLKSLRWNEHRHFDPLLRELYAAWNPSGFDLRLGQQIIAWGKADVVNPTDFLSAKDYRFFTYQSELQRRGTTAALASYTPNGGQSPLQFTGVFQSRYPQTLQLIPTDPTGTVTVETEPATPRQFHGNEEWALKSAWLGSAEDLSLSWFEGRAHQPQYVLQGMTVMQEFVRERAIGADYSRTFEKFILRGEGAYVMTDHTELTQPDHLDLVAGAERPFGEHFRTIAQLMWRYHPDWTGPSDYRNPSPLVQAATRRVAELNALVNNYQRRSRAGATLLVGWTDEEKGLDGELSLIGNFAGGDYLLRPRMTYEVMTHTKVTVGAHLYGGPRGETLGALRPYNHVFSEASYVF